MLVLNTQLTMGEQCSMPALLRCAGMQNDKRRQRIEVQRMVSLQWLIW